MKISISKKLFIPFTLFPAFFLLLSHPSGFDIFHYHFHFDDINDILAQPGYRIFNIYLPRYLSLPYIIHLFSLLGLTLSFA